MKNASRALKLALSRDCERKSLEGAHRRIGELIQSGACVEAIERQMIEEDWKQQVCTKRDAIRVDFYFTSLPLLTVAPLFVLAKDWCFLPFWFSLVWFCQLAANLLLIQERNQFDNFWREALTELRRDNRKVALFLFRDYTANEAPQLIYESRK